MAETDTNTERSQQIDAAIAEYLELVEQGTAADRDAFLARHAEIADELRDFLGNYSVVKRHAPEPAAVEQPPVEVQQAVVATCPNGHQLRIAARLAGRRAKCPKCEAPFVVPHLPATEEPKPREKPASDAASTETLKFTRPDADGNSVADGDLLRVKSGPLPELGQRFGQFELVELIGEGGFGAVYRARNARLDRDVALKLPRPGMLGDAEEVARFLREAQAAAQLHHSNIVAVYDAGQIDGIYFIASAYIAGKTLKEELNDPLECAADDNPDHAQNGAQRFTSREIAALVAKLAAALNYAHQKGIFHRDVKPENIMLDATGEPHLMDFGLARRREGDTLRTREGIKMGTPAYMSPEQAKGASHLADARSDLWSLGVILYELLTGRLPFDSKQLEVLLTDIIQHEPEPPRKIAAAIPRDLETICLKCLAKEPVRRYPSCQHLADELDRWLEGEAITARPISVWERCWLWAKRRPAVAVLSSVLALLLAAVAIVSPIVAVQQAVLRQEAGRLLTQKEKLVKERDDSVQNLNLKNAEQSNTLAQLHESLGEQKTLKETAEKQNTELQETLKRLKDANARLSPQLATTLFEFAASDYESSRYPAAFARLGEAYKFAPADHPLRTSARRLLVGWAAQAGHVDLRQGEPMRFASAVNSVDFSPDGTIVLTGCHDGDVQLWDANTGRPISQPLRHGVRVSQVAFSPDGKMWLSVRQNKTVGWWSVETQTALVQPITIDAEIVAAAFSSDSRFVMVSTAATVRFFETGTGKSFGEPIEPEGKISAVALSPVAGGLILATGSANGTAQCWDIHTGQPQPRSAPMHQPAAVTALAFSPDGQILLAASERLAGFWTVPKGDAMGMPLTHGGSINSVAFRGDGQVALTAGEDQTAQLWDVATFEPLGKPLRHASAVRQAVFSSDGLTVLTRCSDGSVVLWDSASGKRICQWAAPQRGTTLTAMNPVSPRVLIVKSDKSGGIAQLWKIPPSLPDNPALVKAWVDVHAGVAVTEFGQIEPISAEALQSAQETLKTLHWQSN